MRTFKLTIAPLLALVLIPACASEPVVDELAGESATDDAVDGKADAAVDGFSTFFEVKQDLRKCASPFCGGFFLARLNRTTTVCADHSTKAACYAPELDWSQSNLSETTRAKLLDAAGKDALSGTFAAIVRGRFAPTNTGTHPELGRFIVTEAWVAEGDGFAEGVFLRAKANGIQCIAAPCPTVTETSLNTGNKANIAEIDWSPANLSEHQVEGFNASLASPEGVLLAGDRYTVHQNGRTAKGRTATEAYHRLANPAAAN